MNIKMESMVSIQQSSYESIDINSLLEPLGGVSSYIEPGDRVLLKTNLLNATDPSKVVVTNPFIIKEVAKTVENAGGIPFIGDSPSGDFSKRRLKKVYKKTGLLSLSEEMGIELNYNTNSRKITIPQAKKLKKTRVCDFVYDADKIIALPKIKTHSLMILSLASKIMFGIIPGLLKASYHARFAKRMDFANMLLDILLIQSPTLFIMDGVVAMEGEGPMSGTPKKCGVTLASTNAIAMDIAVCEILNIQPLGIPTLKQAKIRKMWPEKISYPLLSPKDVEQNDFLLPSTANHLLDEEKSSPKIPVITDDCVGCGECITICPKNTINLENNKANIDLSNCIQCYCCHEVCTYNAIKLRSLK